MTDEGRATVTKEQEWPEQITITDLANGEATPAIDCRAVDCYNALANKPDPAAWVEAVESLRLEAESIARLYSADVKLTAFRQALAALRDPEAGGRVGARKSSRRWPGRLTRLTTRA